VFGGYLVLLITTWFRSFENFGIKELADFMTEPVVLMREPAQEHCFYRREIDIFFENLDIAYHNWFFDFLG
jgi:hypothetical protein